MRDKAEQIMDLAQEMVQKRGYHGFSYRDLAERLGIRSASVHYHFPHKADLAVALLERVQEGFDEALEGIDAAGGSAPERLRRFAGLFRQTFAGGDRLCPICMLASGQETVPEPVRSRVARFWDRAIDWLEDVLKAGSGEGTLRFDAPARVVAFGLLAILEGGMVIARASEDPEMLRQAAEHYISSLEVRAE